MVCFDPISTFRFLYNQEPSSSPNCLHGGPLGEEGERPAGWYQGSGGGCKEERRWFEKERRSGSLSLSLIVTIWLELAFANTISLTHNATTFFW